MKTANRLISLAKPARMLLIGAPGAGKGTQTERILNKFAGIGALSSGDILRRNISQKTQIGVQAESIIKSGKLVDDELIASVVKSELESKSWLNQKNSWILDGFPRTEGQAVLLHETLGPLNADLNMVIHLKVPEDIILERIENRYVHIPSGRVYNLTFNPPKVSGRDDITGEPLSKRPDDIPAVFKQRLDSFRDVTEPLLEFYDKRGVLKVVSGISSDIIYPQLEKLIAESFCQN
ncbi:adenylate kinase [Nadsonia fulvescens var. elongata DSM 6958]|uniref:GTP:AMP phosphotransferase, mitochondrial n=1 Tax=Nadsonia fulvescens var. elongata DSM 6958 TaxID=857566 RepID=A0A1E3PKW0_9ASCO|nr:adenylate kinase [Nadsonia fulvescens var. elongata DSM 6958]